MKTLLSLAMVTTITAFGFGNTATLDPTPEPAYLEGVWVTTVYNLDFPSQKALPEEAIKSEIVEMLDNLESKEITDVFFQVRPQADAFYNSSIFPPSMYLTGSQTTPASFDVLEYYIEQCHARDMRLHAWINPYRVKRQASDVLAPDHIAVLNPELVVQYENQLYFDPALPEVQEIILNGIAEIMDNYAVDGIHFDDYFYPGTDFDDSASYAIYGNGMELGDFRRNNVTNLVIAVNDLVKSYQNRVVFGISPAGIWANASSLSAGSDTAGGQTYFQHYADTRAWVHDEIIDYIAPQIYWSIGYKIAEYKTLVDWWCDQVEGTNVKLYIGQASYREVDGGFTAGEIDRQIAYNQTKEQVDGSIYFRYEHIK